MLLKRAREDPHGVFDDLGIAGRRGSIRQKNAVLETGARCEPLICGEFKHRPDASSLTVHEQVAGNSFIPEHRDDSTAEVYGFQTIVHRHLDKDTLHASLHGKVGKTFRIVEIEKASLDSYPLLLKDIHDLRRILFPEIDGGIVGKNMPVANMRLTGSPTRRNPRTRADADGHAGHRFPNGVERARNIVGCEALLPGKIAWMDMQCVCSGQSHRPRIGGQFTGGDRYVTVLQLRAAAIQACLQEDRQSTGCAGAIRQDVSAGDVWRSRATRRNAAAPAGRLRGG